MEVVEADPNSRYPAGDPDPFGGQWSGFSGPWRGGYFTSLEGSNRAPCILRWPGRIPAGKVGNELVHVVDLFTTLVLAGGGRVPDDRHIHGVDMRHFLLGDAEESGRDAVLCLQGNRLQAVKWRQWKLHLFQQDQAASTFSPYNAPHCTTWSGTRARSTRSASPTAGRSTRWPPPSARSSRAWRPNRRSNPAHPTPTPHPEPGALRAEEHLQVGPITQYVTSLTRTHDQLPDPHHGVGHTAG